MSNTRSIAILTAGGLALLAACAQRPQARADAGFERETWRSWREDEAQYRLWPGDRIRVDARTAPELSGEITIGPDGRVVLPSFGPVMVAGMTLPEATQVVQDAYGRDLLDPTLVITPTVFGPQKVFVGGEVKTPGIYDLPGDITMLQAVILAGGWTENGRPNQVVLIRRSEDGAAMSRIIDVSRTIRQPDLDAIGPLRRFDVVYVSRKRIADENLWVRQFIRDALPIQFGLFYDVSRVFD
jgi:polysaccharide biosynthesis/export protein PslD